MNDSINSFPSDDEISLLDIWKKLVQYKKLFWACFFIVFAVGAAVVLSTPAKYSFSQLVELAAAPDELGQNTLNADKKSGSMVDPAIIQIKKRCYPEAVRAYNLQATEKIKASGGALRIEDAGSNTLLLSMNGVLEKGDKFRFLFLKVAESLSTDTKEYIDYRLKALTDLKSNTEGRLVEIKDFYSAMIKNGFGVSGKKPNDNSLERKIISMYLVEQNIAMTHLVSNIDMLQSQIIRTHGVRVISDLVISDAPVGPSKYALLVLMAIAALFFAFFGVFVTDFMLNNFRIFRS